MTKTLSLVLTEDQFDVIYDALTEFQNSSESDDAEVASEVMSEMYYQFKEQSND
jgi:hypothetical protein